MKYATLLPLLIVGIFAFSSLPRTEPAQTASQLRFSNRFVEGWLWEVDFEAGRYNDRGSTGHIRSCGPGCFSAPVVFEYPVSHGFDGITQWERGGDEFDLSVEFQVIGFIEMEWCGSVVSALHVKSYNGAVYADLYYTAPAELIAVQSGGPGPLYLMCSEAGEKLGHGPIPAH
ncbi:hypothetical protein [Maricaulis sp.]|uniref:hypothetical protein n=1 Tax=Maricaulis sp. TaxID=1486257 RepID=UPI002624B815|nr:hypothetical protein [Maricaulis sp.]